MRGQELAVQVLQIREQLRRAFDVREQKGDRATLELSRKTSPDPSHEHRAQPGPCQRRRRCFPAAFAWSLHPSQIAIAKRVFSPDPGEVSFARRIIAAMPDGTGAVMIDGKMQDDATWKQAKVVVDLARLVAAKDPVMGIKYGFPAA